MSLHLPVDAFFQVNPSGAEALVAAVRAAAGEVAHRDVWDLYAGVGLLSLPLAADGAHVLAVESVRSATDALGALRLRTNTDWRGIARCTRALCTAPMVEIVRANAESLAGADHIGMAPGANIIPMKVLGNNGSGSYTADEVGAIDITVGAVTLALDLLTER